jgi:hypothetical protein
MAVQCRRRACGETVLMKTYSNPKGVNGPNSPRFRLRVFLFVVFLTYIFFLLAQSMVRHRFHEGGRINRNGEIIP